MERPDWWDWPLGLTAHAKSRMEERGISDIELRTMLEDATEIAPSRRPGRYLIRTKHWNQAWHVVVEPQPPERLLQIVTVYSRRNRP